MIPDKKLKILLVHNYYQMPGGEDTVVKNEKKLLEENGHTVFLYSRDNSEINHFNIWQKLCIPFTAIFSIKSFKEVIKLIHNKDVDVLHVHNTLSLISPSVFYAAFFCKVPIVQTVHNFRLVCPGATFYRHGEICEKCNIYGLHCAINHKCYRNSIFQTMVCVCILVTHRLLGTYKKLYYICLTDFNKTKLLEHRGMNIFNEKRIFIKPNYTEFATRIIPFSERKKQFVFVGRPEKVKGIEILLEAWRDIKEFDLIICGISKEMKWCQAYISKYDMNNVYMRGYVDNRVVKEILAESLALILPTQLYEGFPMTILESFACGTPVIGSDLGNVGNLIIEGKNGFKFDPISSEDLKNKVYNIYDMTETIRYIFKNNYEKKSNYYKLIEIYKKMLSEKGHDS